MQQSQEHTTERKRTILSRQIKGRTACSSSCLWCWLACCLLEKASRFQLDPYLFKRVQWACSKSRVRRAKIAGKKLVLLDLRYAAIAQTTWDPALRTSYPLVSTTSRIIQHHTVLQHHPRHPSLRHGRKTSILWQLRLALRREWTLRPRLARNRRCLPLLSLQIYTRGDRCTTRASGRSHLVARQVQKGRQQAKDPALIGRYTSIPPPLCHHVQPFTGGSRRFRLSIPANLIRRILPHRRRTRPLTRARSLLLLSLRYRATHILRKRHLPPLEQPTQQPAR